jgi:cobalt-zinc-cadmium efflux system outer membrane protein
MLLTNLWTILALANARRHVKLAQLAQAGVLGFLLVFRTHPAAAGADEAFLGALSLETAQRLVQQHNRDVRAAQRALEAAEAGILTAGARQNPNLTLQTSNINPHEGIGAGNLRDKTFDTQFRMDYVIERGNKRELRLGAANEQARASTEDLSDALRVQSGLVAAAYYDLLLAQERLRITKETAELFQATLMASQKRLASGDIAATDVDRISVDALRAQTDVQQALLDLTRAQFAIATLLGVESHAPQIVAADVWPEAARDVLDAEDIDAIVAKRSDLLAAKARADAALQARELARSQRVRDVTVSLTYDHWPTSATNTQGTGNSYGFAVSVPLFLGNHFDGDIAKAEADWGATLDLVEKITATARAELVRTRLDLEEARRRLMRFDAELLVAARRVAEAQEFAYQKGSIGVLDLLDARRTLRAVRLDAASGRADFAKALAAWRQARWLSVSAE